MNVQKYDYATTKRAPTLGEMMKKGVLCVPQRDIGESQNSNAIEQGNICWLRIQENLKCRSRILKIIGSKDGKTIQRSLCEWGAGLPDNTSPIIQRKNNGGFILDYIEGVVDMACVDLDAEEEKLGGTPTVFDWGAMVERTPHGKSSCDLIDRVDSRIRFASNFSNSDPITDYQEIDDESIEITTVSGSQFKLKVLSPPSRSAQLINTIWNKIHAVSRRK